MPLPVKIGELYLMKNKLFIIGTGPGSYEQLTIKAAGALGACSVIVGYPLYNDLVKPYFPDKIYLQTPMKQEKQRCILALEEAKKGADTALICSGDCGIYGMAGLVLELYPDFPEVEIEIIPGITAATSGAALLGAPLGHDFAVISLSDLLTPWQTIENRLAMAAAGDFCICLYNPSSKKRQDYLAKACDIILKYRSGETVCGLAENIGREGQFVHILSLAGLKNTEANMFTTVFIGNSATKNVNGYMITPRGYHYE